MYVGTFGRSLRVIAAAAAVAGYLAGKYGPGLTQGVRSAAKDAIKCGIRTSEELRGLADRAKGTLDSFVAEARTEMAEERATQEAAPAAEQA